MSGRRRQSSKGSGGYCTSGSLSIGDFGTDDERSTSGAHHHRTHQGGHNLRRRSSPVDGKTSLTRKSDDSQRKPTSSGRTPHARNELLKKGLTISDKGDFHGSTKSIALSEKVQSRCPPLASKIKEHKTFKNDKSTESASRVETEAKHTRSEDLTSKVQSFHHKETGTVTNRTSKDNTLNRQLDGKSKTFHNDKSTKSESSVEADAKYPISEDLTSKVQSVKVYTNNPSNRKLGRVGKPIGSAVHHKETGEVTFETYKNNKQNRKLGRVNFPKGSRPLTKRKTTMMINNLLDGEEIKEDSLDCYDYRNSPVSFSSMKQYAQRQTICFTNRKLEEQNWCLKHNKILKTNSGVLNFEGPEIPFKELKLSKKIGEGGFGEVYFAVWMDNIVAVKMMKSEKVTTKRSKEFQDEIRKCCRLKHDNIVKFIGACTEQQSFCIVMEYMEMSLFEALHIKNINFQEHQTIVVIQQVTNGLKYLHEMDTAHCDLKSQNILININKDEPCIAKITDFGLSTVHAQCTADAEILKHAGTPRYSAPEVLRGELLNSFDMMRADIYSLSLVYFEIIYMVEPFCKLSVVQLERQVGALGTTPEVPEDVIIKRNISNKITMGFAFNPKSRPDISNLVSFWQRVNCIYDDE